MKYIYLSILVFIFMISITGCTSSNAPNDKTTPQESPILASIQSTPTIEWVPDGIITPGEYLGSENYGSCVIYWRSDSQYIYIGMTAETSGWLAIGIQPGSRMNNADMIMGTVINGKTEVQDQFSTGDFGPHRIDTELGGTDDIQAFSGKEESSKTTIEFKRAFVTNDKYDISFAKGANKIIWSYGASDKTELKHSTRGYGAIIIP